MAILLRLVHYKNMSWTVSDKPLQSLIIDIATCIYLIVLVFLRRSPQMLTLTTFTRVFRLSGWHINWRQFEPACEAALA